MSRFLTNFVPQFIRYYYQFTGAATNAFENVLLRRTPPQAVPPLTMPRVAWFTKALDRRHISVN